MGKEKPHPIPGRFRWAARVSGPFALGGVGCERTNDRVWGNGQGNAKTVNEAGTDDEYERVRDETTGASRVGLQGAMIDDQVLLS